MLKTNPAFVDALVSSVIDLLQQGRTVKLPGIGELSVRHESPSDETGRKNPRDRVVFSPPKS